LPDPARAVVLTDAVLAWFRVNPGLDRLRPVVVDMLRAILAPLAPGIRVPEELLEVRNMLATRVEVWEQAWKQKLHEGEQLAEQRGRLEGEQRGEANLLLRLLERRFGALPGWARDRVAAADVATLEEWVVRVLDAASLGEVLA